MPHRFARLLIAWRFGFLLIACVLLATGWQTAERLRMDRRIEQMFPANDPALGAYRMLQARFGGNAVAMLVFPAPDLRTELGMESLAQHAQKVEGISGVAGVLSLAKVDDALQQTQPERLLGLKGHSAILGEDSLARGFYELFTGYTHAADGRYAAIVAILSPDSPEEHPQAIASIRAIATSFAPQNQPTALVGEPVLIAEGFTQVDEDGHLLATVTILLLGLTTLIIFRNLRWVLCQLLVILWAVQMTRAGCVWMGLELSMVSSMLVAILTVIAVASIIHLAIHYERSVRRGMPPRAAAEEAIANILPPIFWACATDAAGFAALAFANVEPVRDFGFMMTGGSLIVFIGIVCILPAMLVPLPYLPLPTTRFLGISPLPKSFTRRPITSRRNFASSVQRLLVRWAILLQKRRSVALLASVLPFGLSLVGLSHLSTETNFIRNFRSSSELARSYEMVETKLGGAGVWDILLPAPPTLSNAYLTSVRELEDRLRNIGKPTKGAPESRTTDEPRSEPRTPSLTKVISIADADQVAARSPLLAFAGPTVRIAGMRSVMPTFVDALVTSAELQAAERWVRIMLRSPERVSAEEKRLLIQTVQSIVDEHTASDQWQSMIGDSRPAKGLVTGYYVLLSHLIDSLLRDQWTCLMIASLGIFSMLWIASRNWRWAALAMLPNLFPVIIVLGSLGWLQIRVNIGAAMIAAVALGLTIDGSIHFLASYRKAIRNGSNPSMASLRAQRLTSLPVLVATTALAIGFSALAISSFVPTVTFGLLVAAALVVGTFANLTLLPLLLSR